MVVIAVVAFGCVVVNVVTVVESFSTAGVVVVDSFETSILTKASVVKNRKTLITISSRCIAY